MENNLKLSTPAKNILYSNISNKEDTHGNIANTTAYSLPISSKQIFRKGGIIFPSIKNKPAIINSTLNNEILTLKDIRVSSLIQLWVSSSIENYTFNKLHNKSFENEKKLIYN